jgi:competence protein ComEC
LKRPLLQIGLLYVVGILLGHSLSPSLNLLFGVSIGLAAAAIAWSQARAFLLYPLLITAGWTNQVFHTATLSPYDLRTIIREESQIVTVRGTLRETPSLRVFEQDEVESWRTLAQIEVSALCPNRQTWRRAFGRIAVSTPGALSNFFAGQIVEISGVARRPRIAVAEGTFDYRHYLEQQGIYYQLQTVGEQDWHLISSPNKRPMGDRFRDWAKLALARGLPVEDESLRLEWALTLGWKPALTEEVSEPFVRAATYHIFAVDGLRMAIIFGIFFGLLRAFGVPRPIIGVTLIPLLWFYVALTGWPASAIRAAVMLTVVVVGWALKRPSDMVNSLFAAALIILVWQPQQLFQAGFQLSFCVVLCLVLTIPSLHELAARWFEPDSMIPATLRPQWHESLCVPRRWLGDLLCTSAAAWIGALPLVAYYFNIITPISTPANVLAVPLCGLVLSSNLASLLLAGWFPWASELFNHAGWFLMECIRVSSAWFANWPAAYAYIPAPSLFTSALYYLVLLTAVTGWLFKPTWRAWKFGALSVLIVAWIGYECWQLTPTRITILPVGGGTAIYCDQPGGRNDFLIDCGRSNAVQWLAKPFLRAQGLNRLPALFLSHGDIRQIGGAELVADIFSANKVCASPVRFRSTAYRKIVADFEQKPERLKTVSRNDHVAQWMVLHPDTTDHFPRADDNALVLSRDFAGVRVLLLSDLGSLGQSALLNRSPELRADIVVSGLPTGGEALSDALLDALQPRLIIVTDSEFPARERAPAKLKDRLAKRNVPVVYTRSTGAVTIEIRGSRWEVRSMGGLKFSNDNLNPINSSREPSLEPKPSVEAMPDSSSASQE